MSAAPPPEDDALRGSQRALTGLGQSTLGIRRLLTYIMHPERSDSNSKLHEFGTAGLIGEKLPGQRGATPGCDQPQFIDREASRLPMAPPGM